jgi:hypothetical protein
MIWIWILTGGRPMRCVDSCVFVDRVSGKSVGRYVDRWGREFLSEGPWSLFRVRAGRQGDGGSDE